MVGPLFGVGSEIIRIILHNLGDVMECVRHSPLESGSSIFKAKRHFPISKGAPRANEGGLVLIFRLDLDLIISGESIHKGEDVISNAIIQDSYLWDMLYSDPKNQYKPLFYLPSCSLQLG